MKSKILGSILMMAMVVLSVSTATAAYFSSDIQVTDNTFTMGTVTLDNAQTAYFPIKLEGLVPGKADVSNKIAVKYTGSIPADLYWGLKKESGTTMNSVLQYYVEEVNADGTPKLNWNGWTAMDDLYNQWRKVGDSVTNSTWKYYKLHLLVDSGADNSFQGKTMENSLFVHAVQEDGPKPTTVPKNFYLGAP